MQKRTQRIIAIDEDLTVVYDLPEKITFIEDTKRIFGHPSIELAYDVIGFKIPSAMQWYKGYASEFYDAFIQMPGDKILTTKTLILNPRLDVFPNFSLCVYKITVIDNGNFIKQFLPVKIEFNNILIKYKIINYRVPRIGDLYCNSLNGKSYSIIKCTNENIKDKKFIIQIER